MSRIGHCLTIKRDPSLPADVDALTMKQLICELDGHPLCTVGGMELSFGTDRVNTLKVGLAISELEIDADVALALQAYVKNPADARAKPCDAEWIDERDWHVRCRLATGHAGDHQPSGVAP